MANGRALIATPSYLPLRYGLLSAATDMTASAPDHWSAGVTWQSHCPTADGTYNECVTDNATDDGTPTPEPPVKQITSGFELRGATPFSIYARFDCSPVGFWDIATRLGTEALSRVENLEVERIFSSGVAPRAAGSPVTVYPHLSATAEVVDSTGALLQPEPEVITTTALDIVEAIGRLEAELALCYNGQGVIHVPAVLAAELLSEDLVIRQGDQLFTLLGNRISIGGGYTGASPAGVVDPEAVWIYATGAVFYFRSPLVSIAQGASSFDRSVNTVSAIAERTYVIGWDCCHIGVPVYPGGRTSGGYDTAGDITP